VARYKLLIKPSAAKEIESISTKKDRQRIVSRIRKLSFDPRPPGCEKLTTKERYRVRQGNYRIIYSIEDKKLEVIVVKVAHRKNVY